MGQQPLAMTDDERETAILEAQLRMCIARSSEQRRSAWADMKQLILDRSPAQVEKMERERGLR